MRRYTNIFNSFSHLNILICISRHRATTFLRIHAYTRHTIISCFLVVQTVAYIYFASTPEQGGVYQPCCINAENHFSQRRAASQVRFFLYNVLCLGVRIKFFTNKRKKMFQLKVFRLTAACGIWNPRTLQSRVQAS